MKDWDIQVEPDGFVDEPLPGVPFSDLVILLNQATLQRIREHADPHMDREVGGLLIGNIWQSNGITYVEVNEIIEAKAKGTYATLSFTAETWIELEQQREDLFPQYKKVGWYHSHLGYGVFLSPLDQFLHQSAFSLPWQIALVYDPAISEVGCFRWREGELVPVEFYITSGEKTFKDLPLSKEISNRLNVLSNYLESLDVGGAIADSSRSLQSKLKSTTPGNLFTTNLVEDTLNTILSISELQADALRQAKVLLVNLVGQELVLGKNVNLVSPMIFESEVIAFYDKCVYFADGRNIFWTSLDQEGEATFITIPSPICDIVANANALLILDYTGKIYIIPHTEFKRSSRTVAEEGLNTSFSVDLEIITLSPAEDNPLQAIAAYGDMLYLISFTQVWIIELTGPRALRPRVFKISSTKGLSAIIANALAVDAQKNVYIADASNHRVLQMTPQGRIEYALVGDGRVPIVTPASLCVKGKKLYVLDTSVHRINVYDLETMTCDRHYSWGEFVGDKMIHRLYTDETAQVYFTVGKTFSQLYQLRADQGE